MIDCHCHILPGLDDGAADLEESLFLCRWFVRHSYTEVVCTSHRTRLYPNTAETVEQAVAALQQVLDREGVPLHLIPSLEYRLIPETWRPERLLPWQGNHLLVELPLKKPEKMGNLVPEDEIRRLVEEGYQPVLAHPERYRYMDMGDYKKCIRALNSNPWLFADIHVSSNTNRTNIFLDKISSNASSSSPPHPM